jgi:hypothetical protein
MEANEVKSITHKDRISNILRWAAFGAVGVYLWRVNKVEGRAMGSDNPHNFKIHIDAERALGAAFELIPQLKELNPIFKEGMKEFARGFNKGKEK